MAENYKGLTIRIGGDATGLEKALRTSTQAMSGADQELRKLNAATKLDPGNIDAYTMKMGYMADKAASTAMRLAQLKAAADEIGSQEIKIGVTDDGEPITQTLAEVAEATDNVHMKAAQAKAEFNKVTDSLAEMHTKLTEYNDEAAKMAASEVDFGTVSIRDSADAIDELATKYGKFFEDNEAIVQDADRDVQGFAETMKRLAEEYKAAATVAEKRQLSSEFNEVLQRMTEIKGLEISYAAGTTKMDSKLGEGETSFIDAAIEKLKQLGYASDDLDKFRVELVRLKTAYTDTMGTLQKYNEMAEFSDLQVEVTKTEASVKSLARAMADMKLPSRVTTEMYELNEQSKMLDDTYKGLSSNAKSLESALAVNPENMDAQTAATQAWAEAEKVALERVELIKEQLSQFDTAKIDALTQSSKSAAEQVRETSIAHQNDVEQVNKLSGAYNALLLNVKAVEADADELSKIIGLGGPKEAIEELQGAIASAGKHLEENEAARTEWANRTKAAIQEVANALREQGDEERAERYEDLAETIDALAASKLALADATERAEKSAEAEEVAKQRREVEQLTAEMGIYVGKADEARVAQQRLSAQEIKPQIDTTALDELKERQGDLKDYGSSVAQSFKETANDIEALSSVTDSAATRAKSLMETFSKRPDNMQALELATQNIDEAMQGCQVQARMLGEILEGYTTDKLDAAAQSTNTIGLNAESAQFALDEAVKDVERAKKEYETLAKKVQEVAKSAAGNEGNGENPALKKLIEQATEAKRRYEELQAAAARAADDLDMAKATEEAQRYREQLAQVEDRMREVAAQAAEMSKQAAVSGQFGSTEGIDKAEAALRSAVERAKAFDEALKVKPGNIELVTAKTKAYEDVARLAKAATDEVAKSIEGYDTSRLDAVRSKYGSVEEAVRETTREFKNQKVAVSEAEEQLDRLLESNGLEGMRESVIESANAFDSRLTPEIREAIEEVIRLRAAMEAAGGALDEAALAEQFQNFQTRLASIAKTSDINPIEVDDAAFMSALDRMASAAQQAGQKIVDSANTIDAAYRDMRKTVNGTEEDFESIKRAAIEFSQTHAVTADTLLEMEALGGQLGITTEKLDSGKTALQEFGEVAANLDIATDISANDIALKLGQITNVMSDLDFSTFENFADALVRLGNNVPATESAIMDVAQRIAAVANVTSMTTPQVLGWSAAVASTGTNAESAATSITKTITGIGQAVAEGGGKLEAFASIAQMSASDFKEAWETSSSDALEAFIKGLAGLTDPSTAAIEALDSVGISSVRQETALLALSQTIDNLDDSISMSSNAFNGISDQFGNAGDAAIEAQNKSEGFSGALQIMKNNADALAQSFGDSLVGPIQALSSALRLLTDILNALPGPVRTFITLLGGSTVAISAVQPVLELLSKGLSNLIVALANSQTVGEFVGKITGLGDAFKTLKTVAEGAGNAIPTEEIAEGAAAAGELAESGTAATKALGALDLLKFAGIAAAVTLIIALAEVIGKAIKEMKDYNDACTRLDAANRRLSDAARGAAASQDTLKESLEGVTVSASDAAQFINELAAAQEALAKQFEDENLELQVNTETAREALANIQELMQSASEGMKLNPFDQAELEASVATLNQVMGTSIEVADASKASLKELGDEGELTAGKLAKLVDAQIASAERETLIKQYVDAQQLMLENERKLDEVKTQAANNESVYADALSKTGSVFSGSVVPSTREAIDANLGYAAASSASVTSQNNLNNELAAAQETYDKSAEDVKELRDRLYSMGAGAEAAENDVSEATEALTEFLSKSEAMRSILRNMGEDLDTYDFEALAEDFAHAGFEVEDFADITDAQLARIMSAYNGTSSSITNALEEIGISLDETADEAEEAGERIVKATDKQYNEVKDAYDHLYVEQKRIRDDFYEKEKSDLEKQEEEYKNTLDDRYTKRKRELDDEYTIFDDELDREYTRMKEDQDKKYNDTKNSLDKEYTATKNHYDAIYDARKRELDNEYDAFKSSLDKEYNARKDELDKAYDLYKSQLDKEYNARKSQLDKEYDAVKKQLDDVYDARKDAMDKEEELLKKQLDAMYDARKKQLDSEYDAVKDMLDDEYDARKDELDDEYDLYKKELDKRYNALKKELDKEYSAIKKQLDGVYDARKKELDSEYKDAQKASKKYLKEYKKGLDAQVKAFKEATDKRVAALNAERDAQKALIDLNTKSRTDDIDQRIAELKGETDAEQKQQELRERAEKTAELQKAIDQAKSRRTREEAEKALSDYLRELALKDAQERREILIGELEDERSRIEEEADLRKDALDERYATEVDQYKAMRELQLEAFQESLDAEYEMVQESESAKLDALKEAHSQMLEQLKEEQSAQLELVKEAQSAELENLKEQNTALLEEMKEDQATELELLKEQHDAQLESLKESQSLVLENVKEQNESILQGLKDANEAELENLKEQNTAQLESIKEQNTAELEALKEQNSALLESMKDANEAELQVIKDDHAARLDSMKEDHEDELKALKLENEAMLADIKDDNEASLNAMKLDHSHALTEFKNTQDASREDLKRNHEDELTAFKRNNEASRDEMKADDEARLLTLKRGHEDELEKIKNEYDETLRELKDGMISYESVMEQLTGESNKKIEESANKTKEQIGSVLDETESKVTTNADAIKGKIDSTSIITRNKISETGGDIKGTFESTATSVEKSSNSISSSIEKAGTNSNKNVSNATKSIEKDVGSASKNVDKSVSDTTKSVDKEVDETAKGIVKKAETTAKTDVPKAIESGQSQTKAATEKLTKEVDTVFDRAATDAEKSGKEVGERFAEGLRSVDASSAAQSVASSATNVMSNLQNETTTYGQNAGQNFAVGIANGINNRSGDVYNAVNNLASNMVNELVSRLQINSPSKVTTEIGEYVAQGLGQGIENDSDVALRAADWLAGMTVRGYERVIGSYGFAEDMLDNFANGLAEKGDRSAKLAMEYGSMTGAGFMDELAYAIRRGEDEMAERMGSIGRLMAEAVRGGFDIDGIVQEAFDAMDRIDAAQTRKRQQSMMLVQQQRETAGDVSVYVNLSDVTISNDMDVDLLLQKIGRRMGQISRSKVG